MKAFSTHIRLFLLVHLWLLSGASAQTPLWLSYQGRVSAAGLPFTGTGQFKFALLNADGSQVYWSNDGTSLRGEEPRLAVPLPVAAGLFTVLLGDASLTNMEKLPPSVFTNETVTLRIWFDDARHGFEQLRPDQPLASAPFAFHAQSVSWSGVGDVPAGFRDGIDNDTLYTAGPGLVLNGTEFRAHFEGSGVAPAAAHSDHAHVAADIVSGTLANALLSPQVVLEDGSPTFGGLQLTGGEPALGKLLRSDAKGQASWAAAPVNARVVVVDASGKGDFRSITNALDSVAPTAADPAVLLVRSGLYLENLNLPSHVHLRGAGPGSTILLAPIDGLAVDGDPVAINVENASNVVLSGFTVLGRTNLQSQAVGIGLRVAGAEVTVMDCEIQNIGNNGQSPFVGSGIAAQNATVRVVRTRFQENQRFGINLFESKGEVAECEFVSRITAQTGVLNERSTARIVRNHFVEGFVAVENPHPDAVALLALNRIQNHGYAIRNDADAVVAGNWIHDCDGYGINVNGGTGVITGNRIERCTERGILLSEADGVTLSGNVISECSSPAFAAVVVVDCRPAVTGNTFVGNGYGDLDSIGSARPVLSGNAFSSAVEGSALLLGQGGAMITSLQTNLFIQTTEGLVTSSHFASSMIASDLVVEIGRDQTQTVGRDQNLMIGNSRAVNVNGSSSMAVGQQATYQYGDSVDMSVGHDMTVAVSGTLTLAAGSNLLLDSAEGRLAVTNRTVSGEALQGRAINLRGNGIGVHGESASTNGIGVYGVASSAATNQVHIGVMAVAKKGDKKIGLLANSFSAAVISPAALPRPAAMVGRAGKAEDIIQGYGDRDVLRFRVAEDGTVFSRSAAVQSVDLAERVSASEPLQPGDVVEVDPTQPNTFRRSRSAYSTRVAGVISTEPGFLLGHDENHSNLHQNPPLALTGRVPVKVTLEGGPIQPGDLLTSSSTPGYAMKAAQPWRGGLLGTALEFFSAETSPERTGTVQLLIHTRPAPSGPVSQLESLLAALAGQQQRLADLERRLAKDHPSQPLAHDQR